MPSWLLLNAEIQVRFSFFFVLCFFSVLQYQKNPSQELLQSSYSIVTINQNHYHYNHYQRRSSFPSSRLKKRKTKENSQTKRYLSFDFGNRIAQLFIVEKTVQSADQRSAMRTSTCLHHLNFRAREMLWWPSPHSARDQALCQRVPKNTFLWHCLSVYCETP